MTNNPPTPAESAARQPRTALVTLVFTDIVGSTALKRQWDVNWH